MLRLDWNYIMTRYRRAIEKMELEEIGCLVYALLQGDLEQVTEYSSIDYMLAAMVDDPKIYMEEDEGNAV